MHIVSADQHAAIVAEQIRSTAQLWASTKQRRIQDIKAGRAVGLTYRQIAHNMGITDAAVIGLLKRADAA